MDSYTKLFGKLVYSTVWQEALHVKVVWITMLAIKDMNHVVQASIPGLAKLAGVTIPQCEESLARLMAPDPYSGTKENEGRRIKELDGGWLVLNGEKYQLMASKEARREYKRLHQQGRREALRRLREGAAADGRMEVISDAIDREVHRRQNGDNVDIG